MNKENQSFIAGLTGKIISKIPANYIASQKKIKYTKIHDKIEKISHNTMLHKVVDWSKSSKIMRYYNRFIAYSNHKLSHAFFHIKFYWNQLPNYTALVFLFIIYIILWHPGWDAPKIPEQLPTIEKRAKTISKHRNLFSSKDIVFYIQLNQSLLHIKIANQLKYSCNIVGSNIPCGTYLISQITQNYIVLSAPNKKVFIIKPKSILLSYQGALIEVDDDFWEIIFFYFHIYNNVVVL